MQAPPSPRRGISAKRPGCSRQSPNARPKRGLTRGFLAHGGLGSRGVIGAGACLAYPIRAASRSLPPSQACPSSPPPTVRGVRGPRRLEGRSTRELQRQMGAGWALGRARTSPGGSLWMTPRPPSLLPFAFFFALLAFFLSPSYTHRPFGRGRCVGRGSGAGGRIPTNSFVWEKFQIDSRAPNRTPQNGQGSPHRANDQVPPRWAYPIHPNRKKPAKSPDRLTLYIPSPPNRRPSPPTGLPYTYPTHARTRCTPGTRLTCPARVHPKTEGRQAPRSAYPTLTLYMPAPPMATTHALLPRAAECIVCGHGGGNGNNGKKKKKKRRRGKKKKKTKVTIVYINILRNFSFSFLPLFPSSFFLSLLLLLIRPSCHAEMPPLNFHCQLLF